MVADLAAKKFLQILKLLINYASLAAVPGRWSIQEVASYHQDVGHPVVEVGGEPYCLCVLSGSPRRSPTGYRKGSETRYLPSDYYSNDRRAEHLCLRNTGTIQGIPRKALRTPPPPYRPVHSTRLLCARRSVRPSYSSQPSYRSSQ